MLGRSVTVLSFSGRSMDTNELTRFLSKPFMNHFTDAITEEVEEISNMKGTFSLIEFGTKSRFSNAVRRGQNDAFLALELLEVKPSSKTKRMIGSILRDGDNILEDLEYIRSELWNCINEGYFEAVVRNLTSKEFRYSKTASRLISTMGVAEPTSLFVKAIGAVFSQYNQTKRELEMLEIYQEILNEYMMHISSSIELKVLPLLEDDIKASEREESSSFLSLFLAVFFICVVLVSLFSFIPVDYIPSVVFDYAPILKDFFLRPLTEGCTK